MKKVVLLFLFSFLNYVFSQQIQNADFKVLGNQIEINYDLMNCKTNQSVDVSVSFNDANGKKYEPKTISGDIKKVNCGVGKKIIWEALKDYESINSQLQVQITITNNNNFSSVQIGSHVWMQENLNIDKFRNGDVIPEAKTDEEWKRAGENKKPAWCYYNNDPANGEKYGKLYNWYAVSDPRGLAPEGWHIPTDNEWTVLTDYLGGDDVAGDNMKSTNGWHESSNGNNSSGFTALPGGCRLDRTIPNFLGDWGYWWSTSEKYPDYVWMRLVFYFNGRIAREEFSKEEGMSVRCIKD